MSPVLPFRSSQRFQKAAGDSVDQGKAASRVESTQDRLLLDSGLATCSEMSPQPVRWAVSLHPAPRESKVLTHRGLTRETRTGGRAEEKSSRQGAAAVPGRGVAPPRRDHITPPVLLSGGWSGLHLPDPLAGPEADPPCLSRGHLAAEIRPQRGCPCRNQGLSSTCRRHKQVPPRAFRPHSGSPRTGEAWV